MDAFSSRRGAKVAATATAAAALLVLGSPVLTGAAAAVELDGSESTAVVEESKLTGSETLASPTETQPGTPIYESDAPEEPEATSEPQPGDDVETDPTEGTPEPTDESPTEPDPTTDPVDPTPTEDPDEGTPEPTETVTPEPTVTEPTDTPEQTEGEPGGGGGNGGVGGVGGEEPTDEGVVPAEPGNNGAALPRSPIEVSTQAPTQTVPASVKADDTNRLGGAGAKAEEEPVDIADTGAEDLLPIAGAASALVFGGALLQLRRRGEQH